MKRKIYTMQDGKNLKDMAAEIQKMFVRDDMEVQCLEMKESGYFIQGRNNDASWMKFLGGDFAITVKLALTEDHKVIVEAGEGKWVDKAWGFFWGLSSWPVLGVTTLYTVKQLGLPRKVMKCIERYLMREEIYFGHGNSVEMAN